jgi:bifunctional non-homologous end joining protein LigD
MPSKTSRVLPFVRPIVPILREQPFSRPGWLFEPKYDGFRGMLYLTRTGSSLYSKRGNRMKRFEELAWQLAAQLPRREAILDGEIVALDQEGRIDFSGLMRGQGTLAYAAFDLLWLDGRDFRGLPLKRRKQRLDRLIPASTGPLNRIPCFEAEGRELFEAACRLDLEGIVAKAKDGVYSDQTPWYKMKNPTYTRAEGRRELFER